MITWLCRISTLICSLPWEGTAISFGWLRPSRRIGAAGPSLQGVDLLLGAWWQEGAAVRRLTEGREPLGFDDRGRFPDHQGFQVSRVGLHLAAPVDALVGAFQGDVQDIVVGWDRACPGFVVFLEIECGLGRMTAGGRSSLAKRFSQTGTYHWRAGPLGAVETPFPHDAVRGPERVEDRIESNRHRFVAANTVAKVPRLKRHIQHVCRRAVADFAGLAAARPFMRAVDLPAAARPESRSSPRLGRKTGASKSSRIRPCAGTFRCGSQ